MSKSKFDLSNLIIRQEQPSDYEPVFNLVEKAFRDMEISDHREQFLVERLRKSDAFIPELSLVAEVSDEIIGYILLTKIFINNPREQYPSLTMAPVAVRPDFQRCGIGGALIRRSHEVAKKIHYTSVAVLGHADYYPKFGYVQAQQFGIEFPFEVPDENCMVIELVDGGLKNTTGVVEFPPPFFE